MDRALLVGINEYPNPANDLNSCVKDSEAIRKLLIERFEFTDQGIRVRHNSAATLETVRKDLAWLVEDAQPGERRVFYQSSHGYRYDKNPGTKPKVLTDVLCLYDRFLEDKELDNRSLGVPPGVLTVILDACHAGGMDKDYVDAQGVSRVTKVKRYVAHAGADEEYPEIKKFVPMSMPYSQYVTDARVQHFLPGRAAPPVPMKAATELDGVLFAACQDTQTAAAGSQATDYLSAFTFALVGALGETANASLSLGELRDRVAQRLDRLKFEQHPKVSAPAHHQSLLDVPLLTRNYQVQTSDHSKYRPPDETKSPHGPDGHGTKAPDKELHQMDVQEKINQALSEFANGLRGHQDTSTDHEDHETPQGDGVTPHLDGDIATCAAHLAKAIPALKSAEVGQKSYQDASAPALRNPERIGDKSFWGQAFNIATATIPAILNAIPKKGYDERPPMSPEEIGRHVAQSYPHRVHDPAFQAVVIDLLKQLAPVFVRIGRGEDVKTALGEGVEITLTDGKEKDKKFCADSFQAVTSILPEFLMNAF
ncbi:caspase family protein [Streptomyces sp. NPDC053048]|uniref:caspase family protein n=1 Tax=Streptomyces sp. NPDC053048 TaxID=3365694 RepID=UPI0037CEE03F